MSHGHLSRDEQAHGRAHHGDVHHEASDVDFFRILKFAAGLAALVVASYLVVFGVFEYLSASTDRASSERHYPLAAGQENRLPPEPRLQTNPRQDLRDLRTAEREQLTGYQWVDKNAGVVRIPIDEAMRLTIERGLPSRESTPAPSPQERAR
jgi:hypothetical protein